MIGEVPCVPGRSVEISARIVYCLRVRSGGCGLAGSVRMAMAIRCASDIARFV